MATADFALRSVFDVGALVPLLRDSAFGRGFLDLELVFALFVVAAGLALWVDRPERERRSIAELLSVDGSVARPRPRCSSCPASQATRRRRRRAGAMLLFDWLHLAAGSIWVGGLIGLLVLWRSLPVARRVAGLVVCVPRFSNMAFVSVLVLIGSGIGASLFHLPTFASLWQTSYGQTLLVKIGLLSAAMLLAAVNLLRTRPRLLAYRERPELGPGAASLLRRLVSGEVLLVVSAVVAAAVLSSLPPPAKALANVGGASAHVGPGPVAEVVNKNGYRARAARHAESRGRPEHASRCASRAAASRCAAPRSSSPFTMLDMEMGTQSYALPETAPGVYTRSAPALVMVGHWGLTFEITPPGKPPFTVLLVDRANG